MREIVNVFSLESTHWVVSQLFDRQILLISIKGMLGGGRNNDMRVRAALCSTIAKKKSAIYHDLCKENQVNVFCLENTCSTFSKRFLQCFRFTYAKQRQNHSCDEIGRSILIRTGC